MTDWKKTGKKVLKYLIVTMIAGVIVQFKSDPMYMGLIPILLGLQNAVKHWND